MSHTHPLRSTRRPSGRRLRAPLCLVTAFATLVALLPATALALLGRGNGEMRLPLCPPDGKACEALKRSLSRYGLLGEDG